MENHLFSIAIDNYQNINKLKNTVKDVTDISNILLTKYDFKNKNIKKLLDDEATLENIIYNLDQYATSLKENDNLVVLFSGHGEYDLTLNTGYILPFDARPYSKSTYLPYTTIFNYIKAFKSHHTVLVCDSCYSGSLFNNRKVATNTSSKERIYSLSSKWAITSGRVEPVSDGVPGENSPFAKALIKTLTENKDTYLSISELHSKIIDAFPNSHQQLPRSEPLQSLGHEGGEYCFILKGEIEKPKKNDKFLSIELEEVINDYYNTLEKIEEAENNGKIGTIKTLNEEKKNISEILQQELTKELRIKYIHDSEKSKDNLISDELKQLIAEIESIRIEKNLVVRSQNYHEAAMLRDREKKLIPLVREKLNLELGPIKQVFKFTMDSIIDDYALFSKVLRFVNISPFNFSQIQEKFNNLLFVKISLEKMKISKYQAKIQFENEVEVIEKHINDFFNF